MTTQQKLDEIVEKNKRETGTWVEQANCDHLNDIDFLLSIARAAVELEKSSANLPCTAREVMSYHDSPCPYHLVQDKLAAFKAACEGV